MLDAEVTDGETLYRLRTEKAWTQGHLAKVAGISRRTIQRLEKGKPASLETRLALAGALDVDPSELTLAGTEATEKRNSSRSRPRVWLVRRPDLTLAETMDEMAERADPKWWGI